MTFSEIETGSRFKYNCMYWLKTSRVVAHLVSDEKFEAGKAKFMDNYALQASFQGGVVVEPVEGELLIDKYTDSLRKIPVRSEWPASKHPG